MPNYLEYQYPSENWVRINAPNGGALTYSIALPQPGECCGAIYDVYFRYFFRKCYLHQVVFANSGQNPIRVTGRVLGAGYYSSSETGGRNGVFIKCENCNGDITFFFAGAYWTDGSQVVSTTPCYTTSSRSIEAAWLSLPASTFEILNIVTVSAPSVCNHYTFKVFEDGVEIFRRTDPNQPQVILGSLDNCPENTCAVDCGTYVCCYNSQGISVFNYLK
jgi:hypothetical protein